MEIDFPGLADAINLFHKEKKAESLLVMVFSPPCVSYTCDGFSSEETTLLFWYIPYEEINSDTQATGLLFGSTLWGLWMMVDGKQTDRWREGLMACYRKWQSSLVEVTTLHNSALVVETKIPHQASRTVEKGRNKMAQWLGAHTALREEDPSQFPAPRLGDSQMLKTLAPGFCLFVCLFMWGGFVHTTTFTWKLMTNCGS